ncbi:hypothetical protein ACMFMG_003198 [Clarireedia jacksonii]
MGVVNLVDFAVSAAHAPSIMFLSSLGSVGNYQGAVPETAIKDVSASLPMGYSESKFVAENLLSYASHKLPHIPISIARVGQIAGPVTTSGVWSKHEWFPSLVLSSLHLGVIPKTLAATKSSEIDWVPIDVAAEVLVELAFSTNDIEESKTKVKPVPFPTWLDFVRKEARGLDASGEVGKFEEMLEKNPAIKLLSFYEGLAKGNGLSILENHRTAEKSEKLKNLGPVKEEWMKTWMEAWLRQ